MSSDREFRELLVGVSQRQQLLIEIGREQTQILKDIQLGLVALLDEAGHNHDGHSLNGEGHVITHALLQRVVEYIQTMPKVSLGPGRN